MIELVVEHAGPIASVQDAGRVGELEFGLSRGGAADRSAYLAGCALLGTAIGTAALEMAGYGGRFRFSAPTRFALTGADMRATLNGTSLEWGASHLAGPDDVLDITAAVQGVYGYLHVAGGIATVPVLGGRGFHGIAGLGRPILKGDLLPIGADPNIVAAPMRLPREMPGSEPVRVMPGPQTALFPQEVREIFEATSFRRSPKANRQGVRLEHDGEPFSTTAQLSRVSDFICEGDVQMTGDGTPYVLLVDCQTMGGYPRIGTVLPTDLPRIAQAGPDEALKFKFVTVEEAEALWQSDEALLSQLTERLRPRVRNPREMRDLLDYELIGRPIE